ncbi:MAG: pilus assembly protein PilM [Coprobacillus cateniformis]|uniref:pilus assembly protein PilM n=1 Tax=Longibaculum muris TaxID=1796628 RepID=UPI003AB4F071|nr:pilus assembly protein PilM [Coprobacillus cateniformis]
MRNGTVIYISSENISVVTAESKRDVLRINDYFQLPLNEGTMLNGVIIDDYDLKQKLKVVYDKGITEAVLVVDSAKILAKSASIPKMRDKEILQFVKDELSTVDSNSEDVVYDYSYIGDDETVKGASKIFCVGVERQFIDSYLEVFNEAGIAIVAIDYAINVLMSLVKQLAGFLDKSYAITQIDGQNVISVLFINNEYILTNRSRIFSTKGTLEFENEVIGVISQLKQFASSSQQDHPLTDIYFFGLDQEKEQKLFDRIRTSLGIIANRLPKSKAIYAVNNNEVSFDINDYAYCVGYFKRK